MCETAKTRSPKKKLTLAARGSLLSRAQVELVQKLLAERGIRTEFLVVKTKGDKDRVRALKEIGGAEHVGFDKAERIIDRTVHMAFGG